MGVQIRKNIMSSEKQIHANQQNAQLSTGPVTSEGKMIVASNAIKHGIFTKDLIITSILGKEDESEYHEMLSNLINCLSPQNQMESLLVEKIALDFWRLRRVIRFETGSIGHYLETLFTEFYSLGRKNNTYMDQEIARNKQSIDWNNAYIECLKKEEVSFNQPVWEGTDIENDISADFCLIARSINGLSRTERERIGEGVIDFAELKAILKKNGYVSKKEISEKLIELYAEQNQRLEREVAALEQSKLNNEGADRLNKMLGMIPHEENTDKTLKYERSLQKSIFQNLFLLKKLQGVF
jgi:hypothetical protein